MRSAVLNGYNQVWRGADNYFRSKCSKKGSRPRKKRPEEEESTDDEPAAWDSAGWIGTPNVAAQEFMVPYMVPPLADYDDAAYYAWQHAAYAWQNPAWDSQPLPIPICTDCCIDYQSTSSNAYCTRCDQCWAAVEVNNKLQQHMDELMDELSNVLHSLPDNFQSRAVCFMEVDPVTVTTEERHATEILVLREDALNIAQILMLRGDVCFIAMGSTAHVNSVGEATQTNNVILEGLFARKNFQATFGGMKTKMHGGLYSPEIAVTASLLLRPQSPFTIPAVYSKMPSDDTNAEELRLKLLHILRFCHAKGHRDLVITGHFATSASEVALCFQELLTKTGEYEGRFQRVIFASYLCNLTGRWDDGSDNSDDICFTAFWEVFHMQPSSLAV